MKISQKGEGINCINIIELKDFEEVQNFYEVVSSGIDCAWVPSKGHKNPICANISHAMAIAETIFGKPILYIQEEDENGQFDSSMAEMYEACVCFLKEMKDPDTPEFTKIAQAFKRNAKKYI